MIQDIEFPYHYDYNDRDLNKIIVLSKELDAKIITTEKDYLRLKESYTKNIYFIKTELEIIDEDKIIKILNNNEKY